MNNPVELRAVGADVAAGLAGFGAADSAAAGESRDDARIVRVGEPMHLVIGCLRPARFNQSACGA